MPAATAPAQSTALTVVDRVEKSAAVMAIDANSQALVDLLPDAAAVSRFRRVVIQALMKNPELLECTPESVVRSVFEAAAMGLEPTGASGGAHLVPYNVKVSKNPDRYEKQAQLIPDYRGTIRLVTKPPSEVLSLEARVVKEGDEFAYQLGTDAFVNHVPSLAPDRSAKATTHAYAVARLKNGERIPDVMDRAEISKIQTRGRGSAFSPWATDWDEMAKKTLIKRISKNLPVRPEIRSILVREDELADDVEATDAPAAVAGPTRVAKLAARLGAAPVAAEETEGQGEWIDDGDAPAAETPPASDLSLAELLRAAADSLALEGSASKDQHDALRKTFDGLDRVTIQAGLRVVWPDIEVVEDKVRFTANQAAAILMTAGTTNPETFRAAWTEISA